MHLKDPSNKPTIVGVTGREDCDGRTFDEIASINSGIVRDAMRAKAVVNFGDLPLIKIDGGTPMAILFSIPLGRIPNWKAMALRQARASGNPLGWDLDWLENSQDDESLPA